MTALVPLKSWFVEEPGEKMMDCSLNFRESFLWKFARFWATDLKTPRI